MKKIYKLQDLDCANCAAKMETAINKMSGIKNATVSFMTQKMTIETEEGTELADIMPEVAKACKKVEPDCTILMK